MAERQGIGAHPDRGLLQCGEARGDTQRHSQVISVGQQVTVPRHQLVRQFANPGDRQARLQIHDAQGIRQSVEMFVQTKQPATERAQPLADGHPLGESQILGGDNQLGRGDEVTVEVGDGFCHETSHDTGTVRRSFVPS